MWIVFVFQQYFWFIFICDEDVILEFKVKTVRYFKELMFFYNQLVDDFVKDKIKGVKVSQVFYYIEGGEIYGEGFR